MTTTRAQIEATLVSSRETWMTAVGLSTTTTGSNTDLNGPIAYGIRKAGGSVASLGNVTNTDVATVAAADLDKLLDFAEYRLLENILGNHEAVDISGLPASQNVDQLGKRIQGAIERLEKRIEKLYPETTSGYSMNTYAMTRVDGYSDDIAADEV